MNSPLEIGGTSVYLLGNGYAAHVTVTQRGRLGRVLAVRAVPAAERADDLARRREGAGHRRTRRSRSASSASSTRPPHEQTDGSFTSIFPSVGKQSLVSFLVYEGDVGLDAGTPKNVYELDTSKMKEVAGTKDPVQLKIGQTQTLPDGLGTVKLDGITRYAAFDIHHDPSQQWVALFVALAVIGLITSLLVPRRRMWIKVREDGDEVLVEYAGLARGDDPNLARAVAELEKKHREALPETRSRTRPMSDPTDAHVRCT